MTAADRLPGTELDESLRLHAGVPHPRPFVLETIVDRSDLSDLVPHMNNVRSLHWVDRAAEAHADAMGMSRPALLESELMWFVGRHELEYRAECFEGERLFVCTWVRNAVGARSWRDTVILRPDADRGAHLAVRAATLWVLVDLTTRKPRRIPSSMLAGLDPLERDRASTVATRSSTAPEGEVA